MSVNLSAFFFRRLLMVVSTEEHVLNLPKEVVCNDQKRNSPSVVYGKSRS